MLEVGECDWCRTSSGAGRCCLMDGVCLMENPGAVNQVGV